MQNYYGYPTLSRKDPIPNHGKEAKAIARMLNRGYSEDEIRLAWQRKVASRGEFVSMVWVNEDIGKTDKGIMNPDKFKNQKHGHLVKDS
jgi:hypothetical protein